MRKSIFFAFAVGASALLAACSSSEASGLTGKLWQLTAITEKVPAFQGAVPAADRSRYTITFNTDGTFTGSADCNQIAGAYKTTGSDGLTITPGISTLAICGEGSLDLLFVHSLAKAKSYAITNEQLTITLTDDGTLAFEVGTAAGSPAASAAASTAASAVASSTAPAASAAPTAKPTTKPTTKPGSAPSTAPGASTAPAPVTGLTGKVWQLTAITEKVPAFQGVVPDAQQANYTLEFKADGTFAAKADCNAVAGTFVTADPSAASGDLAIKPGVSTMAACPDGSFADLYVIGLTNASTYAVVNNQLTITLEDEGTLTFK